MVRIHFMRDGEKMIIKTKFFGFCAEMSSFFRKIFGARYLIVKYQKQITCRL